MITLSSADTSDHLVAGRRAAHVQLIFDGRQAGCNYTGATPEQYDGKDALKVAGFDIGPTIDAAVTETLVRMEHPDRSSPSELVRAGRQGSGDNVAHGPDWYDWLMLGFLTTVGSGLLAVGLTLVFNARWIS